MQLLIFFSYRILIQFIDFIQFNSSPKKYLYIRSLLIFSKLLQLQSGLKYFQIYFLNLVNSQWCLTLSFTKVNMEFLYLSYMQNKESICVKSSSHCPVIKVTNGFKMVVTDFLYQFMRCVNIHPSAQQHSEGKWKMKKQSKRFTEIKSEWTDDYYYYYYINSCQLSYYY